MHLVKTKEGVTKHNLPTLLTLLIFLSLVIHAQAQPIFAVYRKVAIVANFDFIPDRV